MSATKSKKPSTQNTINISITLDHDFAKDNLFTSELLTEIIETISKHARQNYNSPHWKTEISTSHKPLPKSKTLLD